MPALVQICIVIATLALVVMTVLLVAVLLQLRVATVQLTKTLHIGILQAEQLAQDCQVLLDEVRALAGPALEVWERMRILGARIEGVSTAVVDELESPLLSSVAVLRGLKTGARRFVELLMGRVMGSRTMKNGVSKHE